MKLIRHHFDAETGITTEVELTAEEIEIREAEEAEYQAAKAAAEAAKAAEKAAVLEKLGLTEEELRAVIG